MSEDLTQYKYGGIEGAVANAANQLKGFNDRLEQLNVDIRNLIETWGGAAKNQYVVSHGEWSGIVAELNQVFDTSIRTVTNGASNMHHTDVSVGSRGM